MSGKVITAQQAAELVKDNDTIGVGGFMGCGVPEELMEALRQRFLATQTPRSLTLYHCAAVGDGKERGANRLGVEGMLESSSAPTLAWSQPSTNSRWKTRLRPTCFRKG